MKSLCITLPEQPDRTARARQHFSEHGLAVHFVTAINGVLTGLAATHTYEQDHPGSNYHIGPATIGIFLSHIIAWSIVDAGPDEQVLIMEDDVLLCDGFKGRLNQARLSAPEHWDMMFLGSCCTEGHYKVHEGGDVYSGLAPQCLHAYVLNKKAARKLILGCRDVYGPIDCVLSKSVMPSLRVLTVLPRLAGQVGTELPP